MCRVSVKSCRHNAKRLAPRASCPFRVAPQREGALDEAGVAQAFARLKQLAAGWHEVDPNDAVREAAVRFLRVHHLRAANALQLAAAFVAEERRPASLEVITLDDRLAGPARKEGFTVVDVQTN